MKWLRVMAVTLFSLMVFLPVITFNFKEGAVSKIDNRMLTPNPFSENYLETHGSFKGNLENYINDRTGLRDGMILYYTILHDRLFHKMVHPIYSYGKDGYVFGAGLSVDGEYTKYHEAFADMLSEIQKYCLDRGVPFLFVFNPAKPAVLTEYIADGINYDRSWVEGFLSGLDKRGVNYIDNTPVLIEKTKAGEAAFNKQYDANHWNMLGAFYGTNAMLEALKKDMPEVHVNSMDEMDVSKFLATSLLVSEFPIEEHIPSVIPKEEADPSPGEMYTDELETDPDYDTFGYYRNEKRIEEGCPKALVFQGSYMNSYGYRYLANSFGEYVYVQDYQNIMDFPYYYNIFKPDCVIFEAAEYTFSDTYFDFERMKKVDFNPPFAGDLRPAKEGEVQYGSLKIREGKTLTKIEWETPADYRHVWLLMGHEYDMRKTGSGYEATVLTKNFAAGKNNMEFKCLKDSELSSYTVK